MKYSLHWWAHMLLKCLIVHVITAGRIFDAWRTSTACVAEHAFRISTHSSAVCCKRQLSALSKSALFMTNSTWWRCTRLQQANAAWGDWASSPAWRGIVHIVAKLSHSPCKPFNGIWEQRSEYQGNGRGWIFTCIECFAVCTWDAALLPHSMYDNSSSLEWIA